MAREVEQNGHPVRTPRRRRILFSVLVWAFAFYSIGFGLFVLALPRPVHDPASKADAIVALTGEGGRLASAVSLLEQGGGQRLLITGVNKATSKHNLKTLLHAGDAFDCCADLGFAAADTRGNAEEAAEWARKHNYRSLIVVTTSYHMPRSLAEFGAQMPDVKLVPYPVPQEERNPAAWQNIRRLHGEYAKFLASLARIGIQGLSGRTDA